jgi:exonuclease SbcD
MRRMILFAAADIHLGRSPARVSADWALRHSPRVAFDNLVTAAIDEQADAVLLAGDVVDRDNVFFEAYGVLQRGVARLREKGIPLIAVAGNHDTHILPELADAVDDPEAFRLLGRGGTWESVDLSCRDGSQIRIWGWSFPRSDYSGNPLSDFPGLGSDRPATVIGLLHADRGASGGVYAPVSAADLDASGVRPWILGHIHLPDPTAPGSTSYYTGSLQALDCERSKDRSVERGRTVRLLLTHM